MFNSGPNSFYPYNPSFTGHNSLFSSLRGKINFSSILNNTQKTLNIINQAIPVYYQIKPIWNNTKTMFRVINAIKDDDTPQYGTNSNNTNINNANVNNQSLQYKQNNEPNFFL